jgi:prepilin-type N-terminal cleavage/methylation domain-containing protein
MLPKRTNIGFRAFTLIELLVVVAIIALLIAILLPSLSTAKQRAKRTKCAAQLHDIGTALMSYSVEYNRLPHQNTVGPGETRAERGAVAMWGYSVHKTIANYMGGLRESLETGELSKTHEVFYCPFIPEDEVDFINVLSGPGTDYGIQDAEEQYIHIGYTYFGRLDEVGNDPAKLRGWESSVEDLPIKRVQYAGVERSKAEGARVFGESVSESNKVLMSDTIMLWSGGAKWRINHGAGWEEPFDFGNRNWVPPVDGANELFADGHTESKEPEHFNELIKASGFVEYYRNATLIHQPDAWWW